MRTFKDFCEEMNINPSKTDPHKQSVFLAAKSAWFHQQRNIDDLKVRIHAFNEAIDGLKFKD